VAPGAVPEDRSGRAPLGDMFREDRRGPHPATGPVRLAGRSFMNDPRYGVASFSTSVANEAFLMMRANCAR